MRCPKCQCNEISATGMCLWCGYQLTGPDAKPEPAPQESPEEPDGAKMDSPHNPDEPAREELPQWRQELAQRLQSIRKKREASTIQTENKVVPNADPEESLPEPSELPDFRYDRMLRPRASARSGRRRMASSPDRQTEAAATRELKELSEAEKLAEEAASEPVDSKQVSDVVGDVFSRQFRQPEEPSNGVDKLLSSFQPPVQDEGWRTLSFRTLSGLVDLLIMFVSTAALIIAADFFSGIRVRESINVVHSCILFLLVYFLYSILFLGVSNQTIGMMMLNLHVVGRDGKSPPFSHMLARSCGYIFSVLCLGIGLLWALFDWDHQCLHDRLTKTRVVRIGHSG